MIPGELIITRRHGWIWSNQEEDNGIAGDHGLGQLLQSFSAGTLLLVIAKQTRWSLVLSARTLGWCHNSYLSARPDS